MSKWRVLVTCTTGGWTEVDATNEDEAYAAAQARIENEGSNCIYKDTHGEQEVVGSAEEL